jgi:hypothetical protein
MTSGAKIGPKAPKSCQTQWSSEVPISVLVGRQLCEVKSKRMSSVVIRVAHIRLVMWQQEEKGKLVLTRSSNSTASK